MSNSAKGGNIMRKFVTIFLSFSILSSPAFAGIFVPDENLSSDLFLSLESPKSAKQYSEVCFITDSGRCSGYEFDEPEKICTPLADQTNCDYGRELADDGCGGKRYVCKTCVRLADETDCPYGTTTASDGCGGTRTVCNSCMPLPDETNCPYGYATASDGCGGTRNVCKGCTPKAPVDEASCLYGVEIGDDGCGGTMLVCKQCTPKPDVSPSECPYGVEDEDDGCGGTHMVCKGCVNGGSETCSGQLTPCAPNQNQSICTDCSGVTKYICTDKNDVCTEGSKTPCGENQAVVSTSRTEAGSLCYVCRDKSSTCPSGSRKEACTDKEYQSGVAYAEDGSMCYMCQPKDDTCAEGSKTPCGPDEVEIRTSVTEAGSTCHVCKNDTCPSGSSKNKCSANQIQMGTLLTEAGNFCYICRDKNDTCSEGTQTPCGADEIQTGASRTEAGSLCYVCRPKTCADAGLLDSIPAGKQCTQTTYGSSTCYLDCK